VLRRLSSPSVLMRRLVVALVCVLAVAAAHGEARPDDRMLYTADELAAIYRHSPLGKPAADLTNAVADNSAAALLGQRLFYDVRLSGKGRIACATCHQPAHAFTDGRPVARALGIGTRNTPTLLNEAFGTWFFWDGRTDSQWSQALKVFENPAEIGSDRMYILHVTCEDPVLRGAYEAVFGKLPSFNDIRRFPQHARPDADARAAVNAAWLGMTGPDRDAVNRVYSNLGKTIEAYERRLVSAESAFDRYAAALKSGDQVAQGAISVAAKRGLQLFVGAGRCELCHAGPVFSDGQFHNLGLPTRPGTAPDTGRDAGIRRVRADPFNAVSGFSDSAGGEAHERLQYLPSPGSMLGAFKTPSLRNVALTAPYMHDGRFATLEEVLEFYARVQPAKLGGRIGRREMTADLVPRLSSAQRQDLIAFLQTLTSPLPPAELLGPR
jgi:cytochrome c peroxidase